MSAQQTDSPVSASQQVTDWLQGFDQALRTNDIDKAADYFETDGYWRDLVAFTWNIKTLEGQDDIKDMLSHTLETTQPHDWQLEEDATETDGVIEAWISFSTNVAKGYGHLRLRDGKAWTLLTTMRELTEFPEKRNKRRPKGAEHGVNPDRVTWQEQREQEARNLGYTEQPYCLVIGGGQGGIGLGARLRQLEVPTIVIDKQPRPGDTWRNRYKSLCLHDPVWYDHIAPTKLYRYMPALMPDEAALMVARAIVDKPNSIASNMGKFASATYSLVPAFNVGIQSIGYRLFPSSTAAQTTDSKPNLAQRAFARILPGEHH